MRKLKISGILGALSLMLIVGCKKNNMIVDQDPAAPAFAKFITKDAASDTITTYYVLDNGAPYKLPIGITNVSDQDRTIQLCYSSRTAVAGTQYNAPATLTIPAGKAVDSLVVQGLFAGYPTSSRVDTLKITICGGDAGLAGTGYKTSYYLIMRKYCTPVMADLAGTYANTMDGTYGPYTMTFTPGTVTGKSATATVTNLWDPGVPVTTNIVLNWPTPSGHTVTIADQVYYAPANWWIVGLSGGTFSSCDQTIRMRYKLYNKTTGATLYNNQQTDMAR